jgi:hypothetical protein
MHELITLLSDAMPEELIVEQLESAIAKYKEDKDLTSLGMACTLVLSKCSINASSGGVREVLEDMERIDRGNKLLSPDKS